MACPALLFHYGGSHNFSPNPPKQKLVSLHDITPATSARITIQIKQVRLTRHERKPRLDARVSHRLHRPLGLLPRNQIVIGV